MRGRSPLRPGAGPTPSPPGYKLPSWSSLPASSFSLEVIKDGVVLETLDVSSRAHYVIGRHPSTADLVVPHPSVSRQHVVLQHGGPGEVYLYDLGSTHGSFMNKKAIPPRVYVALRPGAQRRFCLAQLALELPRPTSQRR